MLADEESMAKVIAATVDVASNEHKLDMLRAALAAVDEQIQAAREGVLMCKNKSIRASMFAELDRLGNKHEKIEASIYDLENANHSDVSATVHKLLRGLRYDQVKLKDDTERTRYRALLAGVLIRVEFSTERVTALVNGGKYPLLVMDYTPDFERDSSTGV